jgi:hypothetical protein
MQENYKVAEERTAGICPGHSTKDATGAGTPTL